MDAQDQVRTQDQEPRAKDQPHDLFDYYTNTKNALAHRRRNDFVVQTHDWQPEILDTMVRSKHALFVDVHVEALVQAAQVADLIMLRPTFNQTVEAGVPEAAPLRDQLQGSVWLRFRAQEHR